MSKNFLSIPEAELIQRILSGEKELYEVLIRQNNQKLYRVIRSYIRDEQEIEDIMQDTYLKAYEKLNQFQQKSQFSTWLIRIGINTSLARIKTYKQHSALYSGPEHPLPMNFIDIPDTEQPNPEKNMIRQETTQMVETAIDTLPAKYRTMYIMREVEGMSVADIGECLEITESNVKVRLHRAKLMIKEHLYKLSAHSKAFEFGSHKCDAITHRVMHIVLR